MLLPPAFVPLSALFFPAGEHGRQRLRRLLVLGARPLRDNQVGEASQGIETLEAEKKCRVCRTHERAAPTFVRV